MVTDRLIIPLAPSPIEVDRLGATLTLAAEAEDLGASIDITLLMTRVRPGTRSAISVRQRLNELVLPMLATEVRLLERFARPMASRDPRIWVTTGTCSLN